MIALIVFIVFLVGLVVDNGNVEVVVVELDFVVAVVVVEVVVVVATTSIWW
jgi:hypothetical protein